MKETASFHQKRQYAAPFPRSMPNNEKNHADEIRKSSGAFFRIMPSFF